MATHVREADLVTAARTGDQDAWEQLYRGVHRRLRAYVARRVAPADLEEVMAETMTSAVVGMDRFTLGPAEFDGWIFGIARRAVFEHDRSAGATVAAFEPSGEYAWLRGLFNRLSPADQEVLELRVVAGLTPGAIARVLGTRPATVRTAQSRAVAKLRGLMEADDRRRAHD